MVNLDECGYSCWTAYANDNSKQLITDAYRVPYSYLQFIRLVVRIYSSLNGY